MMGAFLAPLSAKVFGGLSVVLLIVVGVLWWQNGRLERRLEACRTNHAEFVADVKAKTELARISDAANKARVERDQEKARSENDAEIRRRIADAVAAVRVRWNTQAGGGGRRAAPVSRPADTAGDTTRAGEAPLVSADDLETCAVNTVKAEGWQQWWKSIQEIER